VVQTTILDESFELNLNPEPFSAGVAAFVEPIRVHQPHGVVTRVLADGGDEGLVVFHGRLTLPSAIAPGIAAASRSEKP
jgi:hypothetical protein